MGWLSNRLTQAKQASPVWVSLADAVSAFWDEQFVVGVDRLTRSKTIFHAHPDDLDKTIKELGDIFDVANNLSDSDKPIAISWRRREIHEKSTTAPIKSIISRNFKGLKAEWNPLYCRSDDDYATAVLKTKSQITADGSTLDGWFMTSRGSIVLDSQALLSLGLTLNEAIIRAKREIDKVRPSHIVMDSVMSSARVANGLSIGSNVKGSLGAFMATSYPETLDIGVGGIKQASIGGIGFRPIGTILISGSLT